jgi:hypothetical protein
MFESVESSRPSREYHRLFWKQIGDELMVFGGKFAEIRSSREFTPRFFNVV